MTPAQFRALRLTLAIPLLAVGVYAWWQGLFVLASLLLPAGVLVLLLLR
jgi:hypothetical protein